MHLDREFFHGMGQPQSRGLGVVGGHAQVAFDQRVQLVEQMRIRADAGGDREEAGAAIAFKIGIFHAAQGNAPGRCSQEGPGCARRRKRQSQIVSQRVGRAQRNDAQGGIASDHALENVMGGAIAATGNDGVTSAGDGLARLFARVGLAPRGFRGHLDPGLAQHGQCRFNVRQSPRAAPARQRVVEEGGLAHQDWNWKSEWIVLEAERALPSCAPLVLFTKLPLLGALSSFDRLIHHWRKLP